MRHSVLQEKTGRTGLQTDIFRRFYDPKSLHFLISRKALKSLMVTSAPPDYQQTSAKKCAWLHVPPFTKIIYNTDLPCYLFRAVPQGYLRYHSLAIVLILPPIKLNSNSHIVLFFFSFCWQMLTEIKMHNVGAVSFSFIWGFIKG